MADVFATMIVLAANASLARSTASEFTDGSSLMWTTPLSATGQEPATHFVSSGYAPEELVAGVTEGIPSADVSDEPPFDAMARLGLQIISGALNGA